MKKTLILITVLAIIFVSGCGKTSKQETSEESSTEVVEEKPKLGSDAEPKEGQRVYFGNLEDGAQVSSPFTVEMMVEGMEVEPAGELALDKGHHHILINERFMERGIVVPADSTHIHYGQGQTETEITLEPGNYILSLQFADGFHRSYGEGMSASINIEVIQ